MGQPTPYTRSFSFTDFQEGQPLLPPPGAHIDAELDALEQTAREMLTNLALIQRDDGRLRNGSVGLETLGSSALAALAAVGARVSTWATGTAYEPGEFAIDGDDVYMVALVHTSGDLEDDVEANKLILIFEGFGIGGVTDRLDAADSAIADLAGLGGKLFTDASGWEIPVIVTRVRTSGYASIGRGAAYYVEHASVDSDYVAGHPRTSFLAADGRGFRLETDRVIDITTVGVSTGDSDAIAEANSDAVDELLAYLVANSPVTEGIGTPSIKVTAPVGSFRFARSWVVKCALWLEGQSNALQHGYATEFDFDEGGFELHGPGTDHDGVVSPATTGAAGFRIENIYASSRAAIGTGHHGFHAVTRGEFIRCSAVRFPGDGFRIESETGFGAANNNANSSRILYCQAGGNGEHGAHLLRGDANCIVTIGCSFTYNGGFGLKDNAFLGNTHIGHHSEGNGLSLVFPSHKVGATSSACYYPVTAWASGVAVAISAEGTFRSNAGKLYRLLIAGGGNTANAPTHTTEAGVTEADGYKWSYAGTTLTRRYHVALEQATAASTTVPGTDSSVWVPFEWAGATTGIPLWVTGMSWKEGGSYCCVSLAGETVWLGCYEELGQPPAQIRTPAVWVGGQSSVSPWSTCLRNKAEQGSLSNPAGFFASQPYHDGNPLRAFFGSDLALGRLMLVAHVSLHPNSFIMGGGRDTYFLLDGQASNYLTMTGPLTTFTGGRSTAQPGVVNVPRMFLGSGSSARAIDYGSAAPVADYHARGEIIYDIAPTAGGKVGWVCTAAGTPGTWKAFGAIDV